MSAPDPTHPVLSALQGIPIIGLPSLVNNTLQYDQPTNTFIWVAEVVIPPIEIFGKVVKTIDQSKTTDIIPAADDELVVAIPADTKVYAFDITLFATIPTVEGLRWDIGAPAGISDQLKSSNVAFPANAANAAVNTLATDVTFTGSGVINGLTIHGKFKNGGNAGDLSFRWAQAVSGVPTTIIELGSKIVVYQSA